MQEKELLLSILNEKTPILVLGAGFSYGAKNKKGKELPLASELAKELYEQIIIKSLAKAELESSPIKNPTDLKEVCDFIHSEDLDDKRNEYLTERFSGCHCDKYDYHMYLKDYQWERIFSLNIDDFVEFIYDGKINVQNYKQTKQVSSPVLNKLHGCVKEPLCGYVFNSREYEQNVAVDNYGNLAFGVDYFRNNVIFLGTEFQEEDILIILRKFESMLQISEPYHYFFVSPKLNNYYLKKDITKRSNYHHIEMTTEEFLRTLHDEVFEVNKKRKKWKSAGMKFVLEEAQKSDKDPGGLYRGENPEIFHFINSWDIEYPEYKTWVRRLNKKNNQIVCIYGEGYSGKTCLANRFLIDLFYNGYVGVIFPMRTDLNSGKYEAIILEYLKEQPLGTKCVVFAENMGPYYEMILKIRDNSPSNISHLIFIITADIEDHRSKQYIINDDINLLLKIDYKIEKYKYAENIYDKLNEKNHLSKLRYYGENRRAIIRQIKNVNDIIEVLYISQEGRSFYEHYSNSLSLNENTLNGKAFKILYLLTTLGLSSVESYYFNVLLRRLNININLNDFLIAYKGIIKDCEGELKIRCFRIIKNMQQFKLNNSETFEIIYNLAQYLAPHIEDREESPTSTIFQKIIKVKMLSKLNILNDNQILSLLEKLESVANGLSYYWIQRGIANRNLDNFEEANNSFEQATVVRGHQSYHIQHAQAKNYLAWGIWALKNSKEQVHFFFQGQANLQKLINESSYKYLGYSIHTYADMLLRYYDLTAETPNKEELYFIQEQFKRLKNYSDDQYSGSIIKKLKDFCKKNNIDITGFPLFGSTDEFEVDIDDISGE